MTLLTVSLDYRALIRKGSLLVWGRNAWIGLFNPKFPCARSNIVEQIEFSRRVFFRFHTFSINTQPSFAPLYDGHIHLRRCIGWQCQLHDVTVAFELGRKLYIPFYSGECAFGISKSGCLRTYTQLRPPWCEWLQSHQLVWDYICRCC